MRKLVLLGAGYGNMRIMLRLLTKDLPTDIEITLVDRTPFHSLKTEFYALAAGTVSDTVVRVPLPEHKQLKFVEGEVTEISPDKKCVYLEDGQQLEYDELVIGLGCRDNYHDVPGAEEHTYSIQTIGKSRTTYEKLLGLGGGATVGIIGAGLSGIELASELRESRPDLTIKLFDRSPRILGDFPERLSNYVQGWFDEHNVEVVAESNITRVEAGVLYNHEETIPVDAVVWTAGIRPVTVVQNIETEKGNSGRLVLNKYHQLPKYNDVYVVGDCADLPYAPSAQVAEEQGEQIVKVLRHVWNEEPLPEKMPEIKLKGFLGSLGKKQGFAYLADRTVTGRIARLLKSGVLWLYKRHNG
ncbi:NAD(P)/FAD-dependent oxidoreductase [Sporosarcina pasteurii]|uniref:NADH dehydrogenase-like protein yjlD n=1 Tax=Sporosarcina pasteurii TaxID=1474 RepID=A0A380C9E9_SPOPA|nr:NAD(P)/FAD-dependent oxidoreductase [Sporosarcina pasteurii]MDS9472777.1 NAD(P)/FAD-dependent oxidoreductase [Sporosarcina pasteurii]QBQ04428.1 NAD(P)/FAD-dependent oxidoreductase [Sporosarcina pasteurii]SUJ15148.1 NADH dehydrogenase-like protein yjlD [Sporosarcina pasteurii]